jgi:hypothetical protein
MTLLFQFWIRLISEIIKLLEMARFALTSIYIGNQIVKKYIEQ